MNPFPRSLLIVLAAAAGGLAGSSPLLAGTSAMFPVAGAAVSQGSTRDCRSLDAAGRPLITPAAIESLERCLAALPQTAALHRVAGVYDPERRALHERILAETLSGTACVRGREPIALITGGAPGAGKSTWLMAHAPVAMRTTTLWIDADRLRQRLPEYRGWNAAATQEETGELVTELLARIGQPCRTDVFYDGTMARSARYRELVPALRALGYRVYLLNVMVPEAVSRRRVLERYRASGRYVPRSAIAGYYASGPATLRLLAPLADGWLQIDGISGAVLGSGGEPLPMD